MDRIQRMVSQEARQGLIFQEKEAKSISLFAFYRGVETFLSPRMNGQKSFGLFQQRTPCLAFAPAVQQVIVVGFVTLTPTK